MNRADEQALLRAWEIWRVGRAVNDDVYLEFFEDVARRDERFARVHVFEVLDALVNAPDDDQRESA